MLAGSFLTALPALLLAAAAQTAPVEVTWDPDLVFDHDRERYQRAIRELVDEAYARASGELELPAARPLRVHVHTRARYEERFGKEASESRGAHYQAGAIHMNGGSRLDQWLAGGLLHEMVHAVIDGGGKGGRVPVWLNEGLAERLRWARMGVPALAPNQRETLQYAGRERRLVPLALWTRDQRFSYLHSWAAVLFVEERHGKEKVRGLLRRALAGEAWEKALDRELSTSQAELERAFAAWVEKLRG